MRILVVLLIGMSLLTGCRTASTLSTTTVSVVSQQHPRFDDALKIVWYGYYKEKGPPPTMIWKNEVCTDPAKAEKAKGIPLIMYQGKCYYGLTFTDEWIIWIAWEGSFSTSAFAHELMHAHMHHLGLEDPDHKMLEYWNQIDGINKLLRDAGL